MKAWLFQVLAVVVIALFILGGMLLSGCGTLGGYNPPPPAPHGYGRVEKDY